MAEKLKRLNEVIIQSVDKAISEVLSPDVLASFYKHLTERYGIISDEIPYRLETIYSVLNQVFGIRGARTIERRITAHLCKELDMTFLDTPQTAHSQCTLKKQNNSAKPIIQNARTNSD
jgi:hypothetical protein